MYNLLDYIKNFTSFIDNGKLFNLIDTDLVSDIKSTLNSTLCLWEHYITFTFRYQW